LSVSTAKRNSTSSFFFITSKQAKESEKYLFIIQQNHPIIHPVGTPGFWSLFCQSLTQSKSSSIST
jgi:hypothetical protein